MLKIGDVELKSNALLAPMAGVSDVGFRYLAKKYGAGLTYTEMISVKALLMGNTRTFELMERADNETPAAVQVFGSDPEAFYKACLLPEVRAFDVVDINMGCPVRKVVSRGEGSALMKTPSLAVEIVKACIEGSGRAVTIKQRLGYDADIGAEFALKMQEAGVSAITVHGRTKEQLYQGKASLDGIKRVAQAVSVPVIGNGDILTAQDAYTMLETTGVDGVMIGRGAIGHPSIFAEYLGKTPTVDVIQDINEHIEYLRRNCTDRAITGLMKAHLMGYAKGYAGARELRLLIGEAKTVEDILKVAQKLKNFT